MNGFVNVPRDRKQGEDEGESKGESKSRKTDKGSNISQIPLHQGRDFGLDRTEASVASLAQLPFLASAPWIIHLDSIPRPSFIFEGTQKFTIETWQSC